MANELSDTYTVVIDGKEREIKVSYGLLQRVCTRFDNLDTVVHLSNDFVMLSEIMNEFLAERDDKGVKLEPSRDYTMAMDMDEGNKFTDWMVAHIIDFFISRSQALPQTNKQLERLVKILEERAKETATNDTESTQQSNG